MSGIQWCCICVHLQILLHLNNQLKRKIRKVRCFFPNNFDATKNLSYASSLFIGGLSKFARIAKSVTRNRSILMNFATPNAKSTNIDSTKHSQLPNVCFTKLNIIIITHSPIIHFLS